MNMCQYIENYFDDYPDKELTPEQKKMMDDHITNCKNCRELVERTEQLQSGLQNLNKEIPLDKEKIWNRIEIATGKLSQFGDKNIKWSYWLYAAMILVVLGLSYLMTKSNPASEGAEILAVIEQVQHAYSQESAYVNRLIAAEPESEQMKTIVKNLQIINNAMAEIETVIKEDPSNLPLVQMFLEQHQMRMELMRRVISSSKLSKGESHEI